MARASANRGKRPRPDARAGRGREPAVAAKPAPRKPASYEDQLFFTRLRRRAKWVFVLLAAAFAIGFLAFGVGAGGTGIGDAIQDFFGSGDGGTSVEQAQERVDENPDDPDALLALATALQTAGRPADAIEPLERYRELRPNDESALRQLATLYSLEASRAVSEAGRLRLAGGGASLAETAWAFPDSSGFFGAVGQDAVDQAVRTDLLRQANERSDEAEALFRKAIPVYEQLTRVNPDDEDTFLQLGQAAEGAGELETAVQAYERFLELAPDHPSAELVERQVEQLRAEIDATTG